jgi:hypothetical protein
MHCPILLSLSRGQETWAICLGLFFPPSCRILNRCSRNSTQMDRGTDFSCKATGFV